MPDYTLIRSSRRTLAIQIDKTGRLIVRAPIRMSVDLIERFIEAKDSWIQKHKKLAEERKEKTREKKEYSDRDIHEMKARLMNYLSTRVPELWDWRSLPKYTNIKVTKSDKRWWSCSSKNWLCFSYRLAEWLDGSLFLSSRGTRDLPQVEIKADSSYRQNDKGKFIDAVIIHELAHLREKHHQASFWKLVYTMMPEYETIMKNQKNLD